MVIVVLYIVGMFTLILLLAWSGGALIKWFERQPNPSEQQLVRMIRDDQLMHTYYLLRARLGRNPTTQEIWAASPPPVKREDNNE